MKNIALCSLFVFLFSFNVFAQVDQREEKSGHTKKDKDTKTNGKPEFFLIVYPDVPAKRYYFYLYDFDFQIEDQDTDSSGYAITYEFPEFKDAEVIIPHKSCFSFFLRKHKRIKSKSFITKDVLPSVIMDAFSRSIYKDWTIEEEREMIQLSEPAIKLYAIRIKKNERQRVLYYAEENGRILQVKKVKNAY